MARGFRHILVPHDFSRHADRALATAIGLAARERARVTVLNVASLLALQHGFPPTVTARPPSREAIAALGARLERRVRRVGGHTRGVKIATRVVAGDPHRQILAATRGVDLVVMGTHGLSGLSHLLIGSVAEKVVRHSPVPVLTVRPRRSSR